MNLLGHGVDLVEVARIAGMLERHGDRFLEKCFTPAEREYCDANPKRRAEHLAGRFAAKEAVLKALGTGWTRGIAWNEVEVVRDASGKPSVQLHGTAARIADDAGVRGWMLSLSHTETAAVASAIALGD